VSLRVRQLKWGVARVMSEHEVDTQMSSRYSAITGSGCTSGGPECSADISSGPRVSNRPLLTTPLTDVPLWLGMSLRRDVA
jgi:hypothetical protein